MRKMNANTVCTVFLIFSVFNWIVWKGHEGRIGMAAVTLKEGEEFNCSDTYKQVVNYLPAYARPRFIRVQVKKKKVIHYALCFCQAELSVTAALLLGGFDLPWLGSHLLCVLPYCSFYHTLTAVSFTSSSVSFADFYAPGSSLSNNTQASLPSWWRRLLGLCAACEKDCRH